jgi:serine phosphatase RsbU (regulator of sigma subunit)
LGKLSRLVSVRDHGQLATVLCALIDVPGRQLTVSSAGHLPPLISNGHGSDFVDADVGVPVGVERHPRYGSAKVRVAPNSTVLAFTDGLVERRGESLDVGLQRLRAHVRDDGSSLEAMLARLVSELRTDGIADDSAIAGVRWMS